MMLDRRLRGKGGDAARRGAERKGGKETGSGGALGEFEKLMLIFMVGFGVTMGMLGFILGRLV